MKDLRNLLFELFRDTFALHAAILTQNIILLYAGLGACPLRGYR